MATYPHVQCWEEEHVGMAVVGLIVLLSQIGSICIIAYTCFMLPKFSVNTKLRDDVMVSTKFVYNNYRADAWYYSFLMLVRNLITAFVPAIAPNDPSIQLAIMTQSLICGFAMLCYLWPWHMPVCNIMDFLSLSTCMSVVVLAAAWLPRSTNETFFEVVTTLFILFGIIGGLLAAVLSFLLMTPPAKKNAKALGTTMHLMGAAPDIEGTADKLKSASVGIAAKSKEELCATIKDLDAYDKRGLMYMAMLLDTEFHSSKQQESDAPKPLKRIKSTSSLIMTAEEAAEIVAMAASAKVVVITV